MQRTMLRNESLNNEGALSCSHHDLHLKAHRHIHRKSRQAYSSANKIFTKLPSNQSLRQMRARKLTHYLWLSLLLSTLWWHRCHNPCFSAPSHAEIVGQRAVKGVYALNLRGIKDVKGLKRIKVGAMLPRLLPASISLWAGAKFSVPNKKSKERFTLKLC